VSGGNITKTITDPGKAFSLNDLSDEAFADALRDDLWGRDLNALTAVVAAGTEAYRKLNGEGENRRNTILPGVGWIGLVWDPRMDDWSAAIVERER
jgi:hypothetical protein